jgi:hypothetical protein
VPLAQCLLPSRYTVFVVCLAELWLELTGLRGSRLQCMEGGAHQRPGTHSSPVSPADKTETWLVGGPQKALRGRHGWQPSHGTPDVPATSQLPGLGATLGRLLVEGTSQDAHHEEHDAQRRSVLVPDQVVDDDLHAQW